MLKIAVLPAAVADQIAAGEVVERPASVVKELVENALDAGAMAVDIAIEEGGRQLIRVADDGSGMTRDDALLALSRHATSKIRTAADLVGVCSFGFRGEALPAICSVSHFDVVTAPDDSGGTRIRGEGGAVAEVEDAARRRGTTVQVRRLFYNTPARQKFLRGVRSEWRAIAETVMTMALVRRDVRFVLAHDGKETLSLPPASSLRARLAAIWGAAYAESLLDVDDVIGPIHVRGLAERPGDVGTRTRRVHLVVNGRSVRDTGLVRAAESAFRSTIPAGARPTLFLELTVPADQLDVNVHPAKSEVRFHDRWHTERAVERAVRRSLGTIESGPAIGAYRVWRPVEEPRSSEVGLDTLHRLGSGTLPHDGLFGSGEPAGGGAPGVAATADGVRDEPEAASSHSSGANGEVPEEVVPPLIQLRRTYMLFEHGDGVVLIDQHSAHERVLYEEFMGALDRGAAPSQRLLFPLTLHLGPAESEAFDEHRALFERIGFEVEGFGGHTLLIQAVPNPHPRFDAERCLRETLDALTGDRMPGVHARHERLAATVACKAAVKAGDPLSPGEMRALFVALRACTLPAHDVHGRATLVQLSWDELERRFGRR